MSRKSNRCYLSILELQPRLVPSVVTVGPGKDYPDIYLVPLNSLPSGSEVDVYPNGPPGGPFLPYYDKIDLWHGDITIKGIADPATGSLPVIDGYHAHENLDASYYFVSEPDTSLQALVTIEQASGTAPGAVVQNVTLQNLILQDASPTNWFYSAWHMDMEYYNAGADGIAVYGGTNIAIYNCTVWGNDGDGLFAKSRDPSYEGDPGWLVSGLVVEYSHFYDNGQAGPYDHNIYDESMKPVFEFNWIGYTANGGIGMKLRDDQPMVAYNKFDTGTAIDLELIEPEDAPTLLGGDPGFGQNWVFGNTFEFGSDAGNKAVLFGGDDQVYSVYQTTLYFYNNTEVVDNAGGHYYVGGFSLVGGDTAPTIYVFDNIFAVTGNYTLPNFYLAWLGQYSETTPTLDVGANIMPTDGSITDGSDIFTNVSPDVNYTDPGFVDLNNGDYRLTSTSPAINATKGLWDGTSYHSLMDEGLPVPTFELDYISPTPTWVRRSAVTCLGSWEFVPGNGSLAKGQGTKETGPSLSEILSVDWATHKTLGRTAPPLDLPLAAALVEGQPVQPV